MNLEQTTAPGSEPITTADAKTHLGIASGETGFDTYVDTLIESARWHVERQLNIQLLAATWTWKLDKFPLGTDALQFPIAPLASVSSVTYTDTDGDGQTWASENYTVTTYGKPGLIRPNYGEVWPTARNQPEAASVVFVAGFGAAGDVPAPYKHLLKLLIGHWFNSREPVVVGSSSANIPLTYVDLLDSLRWGDDHFEYERE